MRSDSVWLRSERIWPCSDLISRSPDHILGKTSPFALPLGGKTNVTTLNPNMPAWSLAYEALRGIVIGREGRDMSRFGGPARDALQGPLRAGT